MTAQLSSVDSPEQDEASRSEDLFRRAAFNWALSTRRLVESSVALGANTRVAHTALVDIEYAMDQLDRLFMPSMVKTPAGYDRETPLTPERVKGSVVGVVNRILDIPMVESYKPTHLRVVKDPEPEVLPAPTPTHEPQMYRGIDLAAPVYSKNGKMLWAGINCICGAKATQRCKRDDGTFMEKPHAVRDRMSKQA